VAEKLAVEAKRAGLIKAARPMLKRLAESGFRLSPELVEAILREVGEA
jgi:predicted nucleic acid-binding protein